MSPKRSHLKAICQRCGSWKAEAILACQRCRFCPITTKDVARALILSEYFDLGDDLVGRPQQELKLIARQIQEGQAFAFNMNEVSLVERLLHSNNRHQVAASSSGLSGWLAAPVLAAAAYGVLLYFR